MLGGVSGYIKGVDQGGSLPSPCKEHNWLVAADQWEKSPPIPTIASVPSPGPCADPGPVASPGPCVIVVPTLFATNCTVSMESNEPLPPFCTAQISMQPREGVREDGEGIREAEGSLTGMIDKRRVDEWRGKLS